MKIVAHPLIVAVALGLLGPTALESDAKLADDRLGAEPGANTDLLASSLTADAPSAEDYERVQLEWEEARNWV